ncbi:MAG: metal-dependent hydrolase, partial [Cyclobacteriaceae bacterium]
MDSLTHIAIGAIIGELYAGKSLGKKALVIGAVFQSIPDIDFVSSLFVSPSASLLAHRGFTHSFLFLIILSLVLAIAARKWFRDFDLSFISWTVFVSLEVLVHLLLDSLNVYGVGWLEPFSHVRISLHSLFVMDPFFSAILGVAFFVLILHRHTHRYRFNWAVGSLFISFLYVCMSFLNHGIVNKRLQSTLSAQNISSQRYFSTPTEFNIFLWYCVVEVDSGYYIGYSSVFDSESFIQFYFFPRNEDRIANYSNVEERSNLVRFSQGYYTIDHLEGQLIFNDLRFGREAGWQNDQAPFTFHYYLEHPSKNSGRLQRGRWAQLN